ncbi:Flp pilus assembly protein CpaB [Agrococcus beijingensis]|uniref:Flp pilus assembly protein CpaB n=1 Tax=Agrococcus beijingensis TaxID=3068634 RepID=UPI002740DA83|nr:Flp pilus assembly protein CpaB [Agrococcus sp. REN33]
MIRRLIIALVALLIAALGGLLTFLYAANADARAMARVQPTQVLVVAEAIPAGTPAEGIVRSVALSEVPAAAVVPGALDDLSSLSGMVTTTELQVGEQLLSSRFDAPRSVAREFEVPPDLHQLSIQLDGQRVIGGELHPGDTVGIFVSGSLTEVAADGTESQVDMTHLILHKVLVTAVEGAATVTTNEEGQQVEEEAAAQLMVTIALSPADAERVVFAQEFGSVWLSLEGAEVPVDGTRVVTAEEIFG